MEDIQNNQYALAKAKRVEPKPEPKDPPATKPAEEKKPWYIEHGLCG